MGSIPNVLWGAWRQLRRKVLKLANWQSRNENQKCPAIAATENKEKVMAGREREEQLEQEYGRICGNSLLHFVLCHF